MTDAIAAVGAVSGVNSPAGMEAGISATQRPFDLAEKMVGEVNDSVKAADAQVRGLALGHADNLHDVMIALESARLSMGLLVQVRNRLVDAYQDLMRMQI